MRAAGHGRLCRLHRHPSAAGRPVVHLVRSGAHHGTGRCTLRRMPGPAHRCTPGVVLQRRGARAHHRPEGPRAARPGAHPRRDHRGAHPAATGRRRPCARPAVAHATAQARLQPGRAARRRPRAALAPARRPPPPAHPPHAATARCGSKRAHRPGGRQLRRPARRAGGALPGPHRRRPHHRRHPGRVRGRPASRRRRPGRGRLRGPRGPGAIRHGYDGKGERAVCPFNQGGVRCSCR